MPDIYSILKDNEFDQAVTRLCVDTIENREQREYLDEYNGKRNRRKTSVGFREPKKIAVYSDKLFDSKGDPLRLEDKTIDVARIVTNFPKKAIRTAVAFLFGREMILEADDQNDGFDEFKRVFDKKLRMHSVFRKFARTVFSETKAALVFYPYSTTDLMGKAITELNVKMLHLPKDSNIINDFYPHFNDDEDMDAFIHKYRITIDGASYDRVIIYTREKIITGTSMAGGWEIVENVNLFKRIPVVYAEIDMPLYEDVAGIMDARETRLSRMADTNDYFAEPILKTYGETDLPGKDTVGKEIHFPIKVDDLTGKELHGDSEFMEWNQSIDSVKKELEETHDEMFGGLNIVDLNSERLKSLGNMSGVSRRFMTLDSEILATEHMEIFDPVIRRCINVVTAGIINITNIKYKEQLADNWISAIFDSILPKDPLEEAQVLSTAGGGVAFNSRRTIVANSPLTPSGNVDKELKEIEADEAAAAKLSSGMGAQPF